MARTIQGNFSRYEVDTVAEVVLLKAKNGDKAKSGGYFANGDDGGGDFYFDAASSEAQNGVTIFGTGSGRWKRLLGSTLNVKQAGATGDGTTDDHATIQAALDTGLNIIIPNGTYSIRSFLIPKSNTTITCKGVLKVADNYIHTDSDPYEAVFTMSSVIGGSNVDNVRIITPEIDCNNKPAANGIIFRDGTTNITVIAPKIRNCIHEKTATGARTTPYGGGRALNVEAGTTGLSIPNNIVVSDINIINCFEAISISGNSDSPDKNICFSGGIIQNCEAAIGIAGNSAGFPHDGNESGFSITDIECYNVGQATTYTRSQGIINLDRGSNGLISNIRVFNESTYTSVRPVQAVIMGETSNMIFDNLSINADTTVVVDLNSYAEVDSLPVNKFGARNNVYDIKYYGTATDTIAYAFTFNAGLPETEGDSNPSNNVFNFILDTVSSGDIATSQALSYPSFLLNIIEHNNNVVVDGYAVNFTNIKFSDYSNRRATGSPIEVVDIKTDREGGISLQSFAPVLRYKDLSGSAHWWETYVDGNKYHLGISTDSGAVWVEYYNFSPNNFTAFTTNSVDLGQSGVSSFRDIYSQNAVTVTSDIRVKDDIESIPQELLDFVMSVEIKQYKFKDGQSGRMHYGIIITDEFLESLNNVYELDKCSVFCHTVFKDEDDKPIEIKHGEIMLGDIWQIRYDEWQNIMLEAMRRKINTLK